MKNLRVSILKPDEDPLLAGRLSGRRTFIRALEELPALSGPAIILLDFRGADLATSSFLSEAVLPLRDHLRSRRPPAYVVAVNMNDKVAEEFDDLLHRAGDAMLACDSAADGTISNVRLVGKLEEKLLDTFNLVRAKGAASAVELFAESRDSDRIGTTAWNNRLSFLTSKSLVAEIAQGRTKKYQTVLDMR
jgi:hypothetical protein